MNKRRFRNGTKGLGVTCLCWLLCLACFGIAMADSRTENAAQSQAGLARVDSLLAAGQTSAAVTQARRLHGKLGQDPLYGWQIEGRLGLALLRNGNPDEALPYLENVMRQNPNDHLAHRNVAAALRALGKKGRALSEFRVVVELAPMDFEARLEYGQFLAEFRDLQGARTQLEIARRLCPDCREADLALASVLLESRDFSGAVEPLRTLMDRDPTPWTRKHLGLALAGAGRDEELLVFLDDLALGGLTSGETHLWVESESRLQESLRTLKCVRALAEPDSLPGGLAEDLLTDPAFWGRVSLNLLETDHFLEGLVAADKAIGLDPANVIYRNNRVVLLLKLGRDDDAAREWEEVLRLDPSLETKESE